MNYQNYFPQSYYQNTYGQPNNPQIVYQQPIQQPIQNQAQAPQQNIEAYWIQGGEAGAKSYLLAPNKRVMLLDAESSTFFIKQTDASGMPLPLRIFDYTERTQQPVNEPQIQPQQPTQDYITREEFEQRLAEITQSADRKNVQQQRKDKATT